MTLELSNAEILMIQEALWSAQADARLDLADLWAKLPVWTADEAPLLKRLLDLDALLTKTFPAPSPPPAFDHERLKENMRTDSTE